jgi:hypothetical protein
VEDLGIEWKRSWVENRRPPERIASCWKELVASFEQPISYVRNSTNLSQSLLSICAVADEACVDVGTPVNREMDADDDRSFYDFKFAAHADRLLNAANGASLCDEIDSARARVLPKQHTPQNGLTARSLSLYIGLSLAHEVKPVWVQTGQYESDLSFNMLLIPWPFEIARTQFSPQQPLPSEMQNMPGDFGFFRFRHRPYARQPIDVIFRCYEKAEAEFGPLGAIVLPECALTAVQFEQIRKELAKRKSRCLLIAGVSRVAERDKTHDENTVRVHVPDGKVVVQHKHHRWKLTRSQIMQYNLGGVLTPSKSWWEHIDISDRSLTFVSLLSDLTLSVLVCEDLARPDPVADVVRVVGPNLVIALLMDGPQLKERWPTRHAIALADDPGCSVLSFTSLGMCALSKSLGGQIDRSRVVAIWKDPFEPAPREIELPERTEAIVLAVSIHDSVEWTADGRSANSGFPRLTGMYPLSTEVETLPKPREKAKSKHSRARRS